MADLEIQNLCLVSRVGISAPSTKEIVTATVLDVRRRNTNLKCNLRFSLFTLFCSFEFWLFWVRFGRTRYRYITGEQRKPFYCGSRICSACNDTLVYFMFLTVLHAVSFCLVVSCFLMDPRFYFLCGVVANSTLVHTFVPLLATKS